MTDNQIDYLGEGSCGDPHCWILRSKASSEIKQLRKELAEARLLFSEQLCENARLLKQLEEGCK